MEHIQPGILISEFQNAALRLGLDDDVGIFGGGQAGSGRVIAEEVGVQVERIEQVIFQDIDQVKAHFGPHLDLDWVKLVVKGDGVDGIEIVHIVKIDIETIHHHHKLVVHRRSAALGIDDERPIQSFGNMPGQGRSMAVIQVQPKRFGHKFIRKTLTRLDHTGCARHAIHGSRMDAVKMQRMGVAGSVAQGDAQEIAFCTAQGRPGDAPVIRPGRINDARGNFDILIEHHDFIFA